MLNLQVRAYVMEDRVVASVSRRVNGKRTKVKSSDSPAGAERAGTRTIRIGDDITVEVPDFSSRGGGGAGGGCPGENTFSPAAREDALSESLVTSGSI